MQNQPKLAFIRSDYLIAARDSLADDITVTLNGINYPFNDNTIVTNGFNAFNGSGLNRPNSSIHMLDITSDIDSSVNNYSLTVPPPNNSFKGVYTFYYLYIAYENLFLNYKDVAPITTYNLTNLTPINNTNPVGLAINALQFCDTFQDGSYVAVNGTTIGVLGGEDLNSNLWTCVGPWANFTHYNDSLFGLDDDTPDSLMAATDALADVKSYVNNGDTAVNVTFTYQTLDNSNGGIYTNPIRALMLSYSTPCDTFTTTATTNIDTICAGETVQLTATGGATYSWFSAFSTFNDSTLANPVATPTQTTTYIVTIKTDSGCVKTEHVKVWVNPLPVPDTLIVTPNNCGDSVGSLQVGNIPNGAAPFNYQLTNLTTLNIKLQTSNIFNNLVSGNYQLTITDNNGCQFIDTITINEINNVVANFNANPINGVAPLTIDFTNTSQNANNFSWVAINSNGDSLCEIPTFAGMTAQAGMNCLFEQRGTYQVCLVAYNNVPTCADTICQTIIVEDEIGLLIPNLFTPNGDGKNDAFVISVLGINLLESLKAEVFNRWGMLIKSSAFGVGNEIASSLAKTELVIWDGRTNAGAELPEGAYFYVVSYTKKTGETTIEKGSLTLLR